MFLQAFADSNLYLNCLWGDTAQQAKRLGVSDCAPRRLVCPSPRPRPTHLPLPSACLRGEELEGGVVMVSSPNAITITLRLKWSLPGSMTSRRRQQTPVTEWRINALPPNWSKSVARRFKGIKKMTVLLIYRRCQPERTEGVEWWCLANGLRADLRSMLTAHCWLNGCFSVYRSWVYNLWLQFWRFLLLSRYGLF